MEVIIKTEGEGRRYGDGGTIHSSPALDVEVDPKGRVVAVWFRCQMLPFEVAHVDYARGADMTNAYNGYRLRLTSVHVVDDDAS